MNALWDEAAVLYEVDECCIECGGPLDLRLDDDDELCQECVDEQLDEIRL